MNLSLKNIVLLSLTIVCIGLFIWGKINQNRAIKAEDIINSNKNKIEVVNKLVEEYIDTSGIKHSVFEENKPVLQKDFVAIKKSYIDSLGLAFSRVIADNNIKDKQIQELTKTNVLLSASNLKSKKIMDSLGRVSYVYKDKIFDLSFTPFKDSNNVNVFDAHANFDINTLTYSKRIPPIIGTKRMFTDIFSNDKRITIGGKSKVTIKQENPILGLRVQTTVNYNPETGFYGFGPAIRFDIGRMSLQGNHTYYPESERWRPSINANFDLIRF